MMAHFLILYGSSCTGRENLYYTKCGGRNENFLQKCEYSLLALFLAVQTKFLFVLIHLQRSRSKLNGIHLAYPD